MTTVVLGGTGFIGRGIVTRLAERGEPVLVMDLNASPTTFEAHGESVRAVRGDVTRFDDVMRAMHEAGSPRRVLNLAYTMGGPHPAHHAFTLNVLGMDNCFEAARLAGAERVVFSSSLAVSGAQHHFGERAVTEEDPRHGTNQYATHKIFNENQARDYRERHGMDIVAIRPANVTGADKVLGSLDHVLCITQAARGLPVSFPYRDAMRCPIHVDEIAEVFARVLLAERPRHAIYNTGGTAISLGGIAELVRELVPDAEIAFDHDTGGTDPANNPEMDCWLIDNARLLEEFGLRFRDYREQVAQIVDDVRALR